MRVVPWILATSLLAAGAHAAPRATTIPAKAVAAATELRERALASNLGYEITESLTTEVGPRLAGSEADARAVKWAEAKFKALGYDKVWLEEVRFPKWERRGQSAESARVERRRLHRGYSHAKSLTFVRPSTEIDAGYSGIRRLLPNIVSPPRRSIPRHSSRIARLAPTLGDADPGAIARALWHIDGDRV